MSFSASPSWYSFGRGAPTVRSTPSSASSAASRRRRAGAVTGHHEVGRGQDAAGGGAGPEGRADARGRLERQVGEQRFGDEERGPSGVVPRGVQRRADVVGGEVGADVGDLTRVGAEGGEAPPLVELRLGVVDLEPPRRAAAESEGAAVVAGPEQHDLGDPVSDGTGHLGVDEARPRPRAGSGVRTAPPCGRARHGRGRAPRRRPRPESTGGCAPRGLRSAATQRAATEGRPGRVRRPWIRRRPGWRPRPCAPGRGPGGARGRRRRQRGWGARS